MSPHEAKMVQLGGQKSIECPRTEAEKAEVSGQKDMNSPASKGKGRKTDQRIRFPAF